MKKNKDVDYSFGVSMDRTEWCLIVSTEKELNPIEYIEALECWLKHFRGNHPDLLGHGEIHGYDMSDIYEDGKIH